MTRGMRYCGWCKDNPTQPCDAHRAGYEALVQLQSLTTSRRNWRLTTYGLVMSWAVTLVLLWLIATIEAWR